MDILGAVQGGMSVLGGLFNAGSQIWANQQNIDLQHKEWQREDTAMQRKVSDLKAAGLNPVLAAQGGGSPSSLAVRVGAPNYSAPDLSQVYAASIAKGTAAQVAASARSAESNAGITEINRRILEDQYKLRSDLVPDGWSPIVWFPVARQIAEYQKAAAEAQGAEALAATAIRDNKLLEREGVISNFGGNQPMNIGLMVSKLVRDIQANGIPIK